MNVDTGESRLLTTEQNGRNPKLSPDRTKIVYERLSANDENAIVVIDLQGDEIWSRSSSESVSHVRWDPNSSQRIAWITNYTTLEIGELSNNAKYSVTFDRLEGFAWHPSGEFVTVIQEDGLQDVDLQTAEISLRLSEDSFPGQVIFRHVDWFHHSNHYLVTVRRTLGGCEETYFLECEPDEIWLFGETLSRPQRLVTEAGIANIAPDDKTVAFAKGLLWMDVCFVGYQHGVIKLSSGFAVEELLLDWSTPAAAKTGKFYPQEIDGVPWISNDTFVSLSDAHCGFTNTANGLYLFDSTTLQATQLTTKGQTFDPQQLALTDKILAAGGDPTQKVAFKTQDNMIAVMHVDGSAFQIVATGERFSDPIVSPDGTKLAYRERLNDVKAQLERDNQYAIWIFDLSTSREVLLAEGFEYRTVPTWSVDGTVLAYGEGSTLVQKRLATSDQTILEGLADAPIYSGDGKGLWFVGAENQLRLLLLETGETLNVGSPHYEEGKNEVQYVVTASDYQSAVLSTYQPYVENTQYVKFPYHASFPYEREVGTFYRSVTFIEDYVIRSEFPDSSFFTVLVEMHTFEDSHLDPCLRADQLMYWSAHIHDHREIQFSELRMGSDGEFLRDLAISDENSVQTLSDRSALIYLETTCASSNILQAGWYFFDFVTKTATFVR